MLPRLPEVVDEATTVAAPPAWPWTALVDAGQRAYWWSCLQLDPRVGGGMEERWTGPTGSPVLTLGRVLELEPERVLRLAWADESWPAATEVELRLDPVPGGTRVRVRHTGWEQLPDGRALAAEHRAGWRAHLAALRSYVEATTRSPLAEEDVYLLIARLPASGVATFAEYERRVLPLLAEHGGQLERRLRTGDGLTEVHLVTFPSDIAFAAYRDDPRRALHAHLLAESGAATELLKLRDVIGIGIDIG